jgi:CheY-like chemotaxis protein
MKILSVDDKAENLYMLEALLRGHGHEVDSASNGLDALRLAERGQYDLIVSDILMPRMDGFQLCRELKKDERLRRIPFVFYTATYTDPKDAAFALSLGADRFLIKPLEPEVFIQLIDAVLAAVEGREFSAHTEPPEDEAIYLKEYNARLVTKLEKKMLDLEQANRALQADIAERERAGMERAKLELQLRQAQKMEAVGTLAGGIAHDFNNILGGIIGFAELAKQDAQNPAATHVHLDHLLSSADRASDLVRQILAFSQHREQARQPMHLQTAIGDALRLLRPTIPTSVEIVTKLDIGAPTVLADATQIHQVLANLVTNAWHAIGEHPGRIEIVLATVAIDADFARTHPDLRIGRYVRLSLVDSGVGMTAGTMDRIFEPFFTTKDPGRGTGLGLSVVHGIVKASDGAVAVYSEPGRGTTFHLYFPALDLEPPASTDDRPAIAQGKGQRVLLIDDEEILVTLGQRFLERLGYNVIVATDPIAALAAFRVKPFDVVITDLTMPNLSGLDVGRQLLQMKPDVPVILTTGYSATLDVERARTLGFRDLLLKPYTIAALGESLRKALGTP